MAEAKGTADTWVTPSGLALCGGSGLRGNAA
jgi:hypothetical protein